MLLFGGWFGSDPYSAPSLATWCLVGSRLRSCSSVGFTWIVTLLLAGYLLFGWISTLLLFGCWSRSDRYSAAQWLFGNRLDLDFAPLRLLVSLRSLLCSSETLWCAVGSRLCSFSVVCFARIVIVFLHWLLGAWSDLDFAAFGLLGSLGSLPGALLAIWCSVGSRLCSFSVVGLARIVTPFLIG